MKKTIADLMIGQSAVIKKLINNALELKLMDMGCLPGSEVKVCFKAPYGGPICIEVCDCKLALRREEAKSLLIL